MCDHMRFRAHKTLFDIGGGRRESVCGMLRLSKHTKPGLVEQFRKII